jgi:BlaI family transcriptional regulator, penicillinase repressor
MARPPSTQPTDGELEILKALWDSGPSELGRVRAALLQKRPVATTTVATMLKVMQQKGLVRREEGPRGALWFAEVSQSQAASGLLGKLLDHVFDGSARRLVAHLIEQDTLTANDRQAIRRMLDDHGGSKGGVHS